MPTLDLRALDKKGGQAIRSMGSKLVDTFNARGNKVHLASPACGFVG